MSSAFSTRRSASKSFEKERAQIYNQMITTGIISVILLSFLLSLLLTRFVNRPIDKLLTATKKAADGNLDQIVSIRSHDELGELSESFNNMISELKRSRDAIEEWTQTLEHRVQERTQELQQVQDQLVHAGKMAALGELAAGVAHEINNPLTGVLTFSSLLLKKVDENHPGKKTWKRSSSRPLGAGTSSRDFSTLPVRGNRTRKNGIFIP